MTQHELFGSTETKPKDSYQHFDSRFANYELVQSEKELRELASLLNSLDKFAFDTETSSLDTQNAILLGISISTGFGNAWYIPTNSKALTADQIRDHLYEPFADPDIMLIAHNYKFDHKILSNRGYDLKGQVFDSLMAGYLIDHNQFVGMDSMAKKYLDYKPIKFDDVASDGQKLEDIPVEEVSIYACEDADVTYRLYDHMRRKLQDDGMVNLAYNVEFPLTRILGDMESRGVKVNKEFLINYKDGLVEEREKVRQEMFEMAGHEFNPNSYQQVGEVMYDEIGLPVIEKTDSGNRATGEAVLKKLKGKHDFPELLLEYRSLDTLITRYIEPLPKEVSDSDGRLRTQFRQAKTDTGRLSSAKPNLQNIPMREERGRKIRKAFVADDGYRLLNADYSQMELRILASICQDENMLQLFRDGKDIHSGTASEALGKPIEEVTETERYDFKTINYAIPYGAKAKKIASELEESEAYAEALLSNYFGKFPKIKEYIENMEQFCAEHGYVQTRYGRRRYLPKIDSGNKWKRFHAQRQAVNHPIQGESADIMKMAMVDIDHWIKTENPEVRMLLQIHDELVFEIPQENSDIVSKKIVELMENTVDIGVPLEVDSGISSTWFEGH